MNPTEQPTRPRYSLLLFYLVCILVALLVAWVGIIRQPTGNPGYSASGPRSLAFIEPGKLEHITTVDIIHGPTSVRLTVRVELNHDRVLSHSIENCCDFIKHSGYTVQACINANDFRSIEEAVSGRINSVNGNGATKSVTVTKVEKI